MGLHNDAQVIKVPPGASRPGQTSEPISSLNEAWLHTRKKCVIGAPLSEVIFPLMHNCFFGGAIHAILLLQKGHADQLASDIAGFITKV
jgi:hypothetical protein